MIHSWQKIHFNPLGAQKLEWIFRILRSTLTLARPASYPWEVDTAFSWGKFLETGGHWGLSECRCLNNQEKRLLLLKGGSLGAAQCPVSLFWSDLVLHMYLETAAPGYCHISFNMETYNREFSEINTEPSTNAFLKITNNIHHFLPLLAIQSSPQLRWNLCGSQWHPCWYDPECHLWGI